MYNGKEINMDDENSEGKILSRIRLALGQDESRFGEGIQYPSYNSIPVGFDEYEAMTDRLFEEIEKLSGETKKIYREQVLDSLHDIVAQFQIRKAVMWNTNNLRELNIEESLDSLGIELLSPNAEPRLLAGCDLGITEVDYAIVNTGTLVLNSSPEKPRLVSLLPPVHLAILPVVCLVREMKDVFIRNKHSNYMVFITGPSRTADIELTVSLGVHGPKSLIVWSLID